MFASSGTWRSAPRRGVQPQLHGPVRLRGPGGARPQGAKKGRERRPAGSEDPKGRL